MTEKDSLTELDEYFHDRQAMLSTVATAVAALAAKKGVEFLRSPEATTLKKLATQLFPAPDLTDVYEAAQKRFQESVNRKGEPTLKEKAKALFDTWPDAEAVSQTRPGSWHTLGECPSQPHCPMHRNQPNAPWMEDMAKVGAMIPEDIELQLSWYNGQNLVYNPEDARAAASPLGTKLHEALEAYVASSSAANKNRVVEEALWWAITPAMRARTSFLQNLVLNDRASQVHKKEFSQLSVWCQLASKLCEERLQSEVLAREMRERLTEYKPKKQGITVQLDGDVTMECGCAEGVVCATHQASMSDGRAPCRPFHPVSALDFTPDGGKCCRRCGHIFPSPVTIELGGSFDFSTMGPFVVIPHDAGFERGVSYPERLPDESYGDWKNRTFFQRYAGQYSVIAETGDRIPPSYTQTGTDTTPNCCPYQAPTGPDGTVFLDECQECGGEIGWIDCPTGGWWSHKHHPANEHDARAGDWDHEPHGTCPGWPPGQLE